MQNQSSRINKNQLYQDFQSHKYRRKSQSRGKGITQILQKMKKNSEQLIRSETQMLKTKRHFKQVQQKKTYYKDVYQDSLKPGCAVLRTFSQSKPLNTGDRYLDQKQKQKVIYSDRVYTKMPNIVSGTYVNRLNTEVETFLPIKLKLSEQETQYNKNWTSKKFSEYDKIVTEQTGPLRIMMKKRVQCEKKIKLKNQIKIGINSNVKNLFSTFESNNNDYYETINVNKVTNPVLKINLKDRINHTLNKLKSQSSEAFQTTKSNQLTTDHFIIGKQTKEGKDILIVGGSLQISKIKEKAKKMNGLLFKRELGSMKSQENQASSFIMKGKNRVLTNYI